MDSALWNNSTHTRQTDVVYFKELAFSKASNDKIVNTQAGT